MYFVKSCEKRFNVKNCKTLFIGTLNYYRNTEDETIKDEHEGKFSQYINIVDMNMPIDYFNSLINTTGSINSTNTGVLHTQPSTAGADYILVTCQGFTNFIELRNKFVYCLSIKSDHTKKVQHFEYHDDYWYFSGENFNEFCEDVTYNLGMQIIETSLTQKIFEEDYTTNNLKINVRGFEVVYRDRVINITNEVLLKEPKLALELMKSIVFLKPEKYKPEQEYRLCFEVYDGDKMLTPIVDGLVIPVTSLQNFVK